MKSFNELCGDTYFCVIRQVVHLLTIEHQRIKDPRYVSQPVSPSVE